MEYPVYKNRTREEVVAAFRESIRKKHEWQLKAEEEIRKIREERNPTEPNPKEGGSCTLTAAGTALLFFFGETSHLCL